MRGKLQQLFQNNVFSYYQRSAKNGDVGAYFKIGELYEQNNDIEHALQAYLNGARSFNKMCEDRLVNFAKFGNRLAQYYCAIVSECKQDWVMAKDTYEAVIVEQNFDIRYRSHAMYRLGCLYQADRKGQANTIVLKKNLLQALLWYRKAASYHNKYALDSLLKMSETISKASVVLAELYESGENGFVKNIDRAVEYYERASRLGDSGASFYLGQLHECGQKIEQDMLKAFAYYAHAAYQNHTEAKAHLESTAKKGNVKAQYALGYHYYHKKNNITEAVHWCMQAVEQGHKLALTYLTQTDFSSDIDCHIADCYERGKGVRQDVKRAIQFYEKAYAKGDKNAAYHLGNIYRADYHDVPKDIETAFRYYIASAEKGNKDALFSLEILAEEVSATRQLELANLYRFFSFKEKAVYWEDQAKQATSVSLITLITGEK